MWTNVAVRVLRRVPLPEEDAFVSAEGEPHGSFGLWVVSTTHRITERSAVAAQRGLPSGRLYTHSEDYRRGGCRRAARNCEKSDPLAADYQDSLRIVVSFDVY